MKYTLESLVFDIQKHLDKYTIKQSLESALALHRKILELPKHFYGEGCVFIRPNFDYSLQNFVITVKNIKSSDIDETDIEYLMNCSLINVVNNIGEVKFRITKNNNFLDKEQTIKHAYYILAFSEDHQYRQPQITDLMELLSHVYSCLDFLGESHVYKNNLNPGFKDFDGVRTGIGLEYLLKKIDVKLSYLNLSNYCNQKQSHSNYDISTMSDIKKDIDYLFELNNNLIEIKLMLQCVLVNKYLIQFDRVDQSISLVKSNGDLL